jgi:prepilin-type N-terminal cleavage/methylation domain-containing protein
MTCHRRRAAQAGFTLIEALIGVVVLSLGLLALGAAAGISLRDLTRSRRDMQYWADVQQVVDSLIGRGWGNVSSGSRTVNGRPMSWTLTTVSPNSQRLDILVTRTKYTSYDATTQDSIVVFLAKPTPGS